MESLSSNLCDDSLLEQDKELTSRLSNIFMNITLKIKPSLSPNVARASSESIIKLTQRSWMIVNGELIKKHDPIITTAE